MRVSAPPTIGPLAARPATAMPTSTTADTAQIRTGLGRARVSDGVKGDTGAPPFVTLSEPCRGETC
ncbi:hypothetical protein [Sphingomonas sp. Leaf20]|uniref:hypothetical protein n=1 Tax=Sphingomonas sp. Leaf20 TaxID=1735685 RepID=UPI0012E0D77A|nr:hypothetical protein [Sphingomonas sp. Leaf20]